MTKKYRNRNREIPRFAPVEDPHWVGGETILFVDTVKKDTNM